MQPATSTAKDAYEEFASVYDRFTAASDYEAWARSLEPLLDGLGATSRTLLDLCCGTGKGFRPFLRRGYRVTGCDVSPAMLGQARAANPGVPLIVADVRTLGRVGSFGVVTCFDDSLNYLLAPADLRMAFATIAQNLAPCGVGLFDLNTVLAYRTTFASDVTSSVDGVQFRWRGQSLESCSPGALASATIEARTGDRLIVSHHVQRHFPEVVVRTLLDSVALECVGLYGVRPDGSLDPEPDETAQLKVLYVVRHSNP